jgi:transposase-like protein
MLKGFWLSVLTKLRNYGPRDILICCCDGLSGLPEAITTAFPSLEALKNTFADGAITR